MVKRAFDLLFSLISIALLLPVAILLAMLIYFDDRGPVFFCQQRVGLNKQPFKLYKFRSMRVKLSPNNGSFDAGNLSNITRVGKILRKTKLDEIPQFFNVLKGDMSLVGPRPEVERWVSESPQLWDFILTVKPGITDNAAIRFRNEEEILANISNPELYYKEIILPQKLNIYREYILLQSFVGDMRIIFKTLISIFSNWK